MLALDGGSGQATRALFLMFGALVALAALTIDRNNLIDQQNYVDYFSEGPTWSWLGQFANVDGGWPATIARLFTEEFLWRLWTAVIGAWLAPTSAVLLTVMLLNVFMVLACARLANANIALLIWLTLPVGFVVTGIIQIRQGMALAVFLLVSLRLSTPVVGALLASLIHTTFLPILLFACVAAVLRRHRLLAAGATAALGIAGAEAGSAIFAAFGGRRLSIVSVDEGASSINYVLVALLCVLPSLERCIFRPTTAHDGTYALVIDQLAALHVGLVAFTALSFFIFPVGTSRIGYMITLLLIPILGSVSADRSSAVLAAVAAWLTVGYLVAKFAVDGQFKILLGL